MQDTALRLVLSTGKQLSFVYDVADLYKMEVVVPTAFGIVAESPDQVESRTRHALREAFREARLLERVVRDLHDLFGYIGGDESLCRR